MSANAHGHTVAAWTGVTVSFVGFMLAGVAMVYSIPVLVIIGLVVAAGGAVVGKVLSAAGFGKKPDTHAVATSKDAISSSVSA
ncbi:HGxxPAAW family protein [Streptacidiphilus anmyonensis]|uniref:HGxxPAAW family protein n=1 Tax=Streptacidiphilus anmyonensis TaxID=405782 RepID=UPI0005A9274F|nr:HGxxPAAW family protein [Streptacidiphilus anmyonensis]